MLFLVCRRRRVNQGNNRQLDGSNIQERQEEGRPPEEERDRQEVRNVLADGQANEGQPLLGEHQQPGGGRWCQIL